MMPERRPAPFRVVSMRAERKRLKRASTKPRFKLDCTRTELLRLAAGLQRRKRAVRLDVSRRQLGILQDALDAYAGDDASAETGAAAQTRALQRTLHLLTGEKLPPTQATRRRLLKTRGNAAHAKPRARGAK